MGYCRVSGFWHCRETADSMSIRSSRVRSIGRLPVLSYRAPGSQDRGSIGGMWSGSWVRRSAAQAVIASIRHAGRGLRSRIHRVKVSDGGVVGGGTRGGGVHHGSVPVAAPDPYSPRRYYSRYGQHGFTITLWIPAPRPHRERVEQRRGGCGARSFPISGTCFPGAARRVGVGIAEQRSPDS